MNAWLNRCVFNLDLNRKSVSETRTLTGRLFQSLGAKYEKVLPPLVDFSFLGTTKSPVTAFVPSFLRMRKKSREQIVF